MQVEVLHPLETAVGLAGSLDKDSFRPIRQLGAIGSFILDPEEMCSLGDLWWAQSHVARQPSWLCARTHFENVVCLGAEMLGLGDVGYGRSFGDPAAACAEKLRCSE